MARKERTIKSPQITIIGEGLTERLYFTHLRRLKNYRYTCKPRNFARQSLEEMEKLVDNAIADLCIAVLVFDADVARTNKLEQAKLDALQRKYKNSQNVIICDSMPSIEFWFLLHYLNTTRHFNTSNDVIDVLRKYIPAFDKNERFLSQEKWVAELLSEGRVDTACKRARSIDTQSASYSNVYKAFAAFDSGK